MTGQNGEFSVLSKRWTSKQIKTTLTDTSLSVLLCNGGVCVCGGAMWQKSMWCNQTGQHSHDHLPITLITEAQRHPLVGQFAGALVLALQ